MENLKDQFRHIFLSYFKGGKSANQTACKICTAYRQYTISDDTFQDNLKDLSAKISTLKMLLLWTTILCEGGPLKLCYH